MKKNYLFGMALMASLAFFSCTNEVIYVHDGESSEQVSDEQIITLQVSNGGDGLTTRAGRPLYSAEAKQDIQTVKLWICNASNEVVYEKTIASWNTDQVSTAYTTGGHGRQTTIVLDGDNKLAAGTYDIYAVGYSTNSDYNLEAVTGVTKGGDTFNENMVLPIKEDATNKIGEEIFAGQKSSLNVTSGKGFRESIVLNRQVAGAFVYVKDIPYFENAKYLKLVASAQNQSLVLGNFNSVDLVNNGSGNDTNVKYVVNGTNGKSGSDTYEICTIDLTKWFINIKDEDSNGLIDVTNWTNPLRPAGSPTAGTFPTFQKGSAFGGEFVIPFLKTTSQTLTLQLTNAAGEELMSWNMNLSATDLQVTNSAGKVSYWDADALEGAGDWTTIESEANDETHTNYSLVRNHLYGIGTRMNDQANPNKPGVDPDPDKPEEKPDSGIDDPESLNNKQELTLRVNDNWEVIHGMELE